MAEDTTATTNTADDTQGDTATAAAEKKQGRTYTQSELDEIVNGALGKKLKDMPSKEEISAFRDWKKTQKTEAEKAAEREAEYQQTAHENAMLKAENKTLSAQCKAEFSEFVAEKVLAMDGDDFEKNLAAYKKDHPQYFGETTVRRVSSGASVSGGDDRKPDTTNSIMNDLLRNRGH